MKADSQSETGLRISRAEALERAPRLTEAKFEGLLDAHLGDGLIIDVAEGTLIEVKLGGENRVDKGAFVLTAQEIWAFRPRGMLGAKKPMTALIHEIDEIGTNVGPDARPQIIIKFKLDVITHGTAPVMWKLRVREADRARFGRAILALM